MTTKPPAPTPDTWTHTCTAEPFKGSAVRVIAQSHDLNRDCVVLGVTDRGTRTVRWVRAERLTPLDGMPDETATGQPIERTPNPERDATACPSCDGIGTDGCIPCGGGGISLPAFPLELK